MIALFYIEKALNATSTWLVQKPVSVKKLQLTPPFAAAATVVVLFRDGPGGTVKARLAAGATVAVDRVDCAVGELITFDIGIYCEVQGACFVGAYCLGNPTGPQGP